jgi:hypothetical protein
MRRLFLVAVSAAISLVCVPLAEAQVLEKLMSDAWGGTYETPDPSHIAKAEGLFLKMFKGDVGASVRREWEALGFMLEAIPLPNGTAHYVRERPYQRTGRGLYVIRPQGGQPVVVEAPHKSNDLKTDVIAARMMEERAFTAVAWNTVSRSQVDLAHESSSFYNAFTRAFGLAFPTGSIVQLHGFNEDNHDLPLGTEQILSGATKVEPAWLPGYGLCLDTAGISVVLYPSETTVPLGGTTNANAKAFRAVGGEVFLHSEKTRPFRNSLASDAGRRGKFADCLLP